MIKSFSLVLFLAYFSPFSFGQRTETSLNFNQRKVHLLLESENDLLFQTDYYYTAGIALTYVHKTLKNTPAQLILKSKTPNLISFSGFGIEQRIFTPFSITSPNSIENDRPYTAYVMLSNFSTIINLDKHLKIGNEIGIGILGPAAKGEEMQTYVHKTIGSDLPEGWENQLSNAYLIDYQFRIEKGFFNDRVANHLLPFGELRVGTLTDKISVGLLFKFGNVIKTLKNTSKSEDTKKTLVWEWLFEAKYQRVFYDATLQGGVLGKNKVIGLSKQEILSRQYHLRTGVNLYYKRLFLRYMVQFNSKNFSSSRIHQYGGIIIGYSF